jgi:hypothetical protein
MEAVRNVAPPPASRHYNHYDSAGSSAGAVHSCVEVEQAAALKEALKQTAEAAAEARTTDHCS